MAEMNEAATDTALEGELEIGQVSGMIDDVPTVAELMDRLLGGYDEAARRLARRDD